MSESMFCCIRFIEYYVYVSIMFTLFVTPFTCSQDIHWGSMPKIKTSRVKYPEGWELIEPTIRELDAKMREGMHRWLFIWGTHYWCQLLFASTGLLLMLCPHAAENDPHDGKRKCEALWPIFRISHQRSRYIYDLYYRRKEISQELYEFCLDQGYADRNLIAKWKKASILRSIFVVHGLLVSLFDFFLHNILFFLGWGWEGGRHINIPYILL